MKTPAPTASSAITRAESFDGDSARWDAALAECEHVTFCHLSGWREIMTDVLGHETMYSVAVDEGGEWCGLLPLVRVRSRLLGDYLLSMPFLNYGGPVGSEAARSLLASHAVETARALDPDLLELRNRERLAPPPAPLRLSERKVTVLLPLPDLADTLWKDGFKGKLRSQIRRPQKEGMETEFGPGQLEPFYEVFARNMRDLGTPVLPKAFFERIAAAFPNEVVFGVVRSGTTPVAAGCGFLYGGEFEMTWASSMREFNRQAPNMLLYWSFMERMIEQGVGVFNFGRCTPGGGTHRFKLQWGGDDVPLPWSQWSPSGVEATPSPDRPLFRLATAAWQRLPLPVANRVGPLFARRLP